MFRRSWRFISPVLSEYYELVRKAFIPFFLVALAAPAFRLLASAGPVEFCRQVWGCTTVVDHPILGSLVLFGIPLVLSALYTLGWQAHRVLRPPAISTFLLTKKLHLEHFDLGNEPQDFYFNPPEYASAVEALRAIKQGREAQAIGILISGSAKIGKTRLALQVMSQVLGQEDRGFHVLRWLAYHTTLQVTEFERLEGMRLVLFVDDVQEFTDPNKIGALRDALQTLKVKCKPLIVVATFRTPNQSAREQLLRVFEQLIEIRLSPMEEETGAKFKQAVKEYLQNSPKSPRYIDPESFDGKPGSVMLGLEYVKSVVGTLPQDPTAILQAMGLLRHLGVNVYPELRLRRVAVRVFSMRSTEHAWDRARDYLVDSDLVAPRHKARSGEWILRMRNDNYLDECLGPIFPEHGRRMEDYYPLVVEALSRTTSVPADSSALFDVSDTLRDIATDGSSDFAYLALQAAWAGLDGLDKDEPPGLWARGQTLRGLALANPRLPGSREANLIEAGYAFTKALEVLDKNKSELPVRWANLTHDRGYSRFELGQLAASRGDLDGCRVHKQAALSDFWAALTVFTRDGYPRDFEAVDGEIHEVEATLCY